LNGSDVQIFVLLVDRLFTFSELGNMPHASMSFSVLRIGNSALQHWLSAMYSASVELNSISVCSLLDQCIGTPAKTLIKHVRDKQELRRCAISWCHTPAKSLSQYASSETCLFSFMMSGLYLVHCK
jgi:hypothetical protein